VEARTFVERMFDVVTLHKLKAEDCKEAITRPIHNRKIILHNTFCFGKRAIHGLTMRHASCP
jgi:hypothetical protein